VLADRIGEVSEAGTEPLDRRQVRIGLHPLAKPLDQGLEAGDVEALLAAEVLEDQPVGNASGLGDLVDGDVVVIAIAEDLEGCRQQLESPLAGPLGCQRS
jgi:hypothetical protein